MVDVMEAKALDLAQEVILRQTKKEGATHGPRWTTDNTVTHERNEN